MGFIRSAIATAIDLTVEVFIGPSDSDDRDPPDERTIDQVPFAEIRQADGTDIAINADGHQIS